MSQLTERAKQFLLETPEGVSPSDNPWQREKGSTYVRFDGIRVENGPPDGFGAKVTFRWRGHDMVVMRVEGVRLEEGASLNLVGIDGRQSVILEPERE